MTLQEWGNSKLILNFNATLYIPDALGLLTFNQANTDYSYFLRNYSSMDVVWVIIDSSTTVLGYGTLPKNTANWKLYVYYNNTLTEVNPS